MGAGAGGGFRFRVFERLKHSEGIRKVFKQGRAYSCPGAKLFVIRNGLPYNRIGFTLARKFGSAPRRNRAKRLGREAYRLLRPSLAVGFDLVLLVYPSREPPPEPRRNGPAVQRPGSGPRRMAGAPGAHESGTPARRALPEPRRAAGGPENPRPPGRALGLDLRMEQLRGLLGRAGLIRNGN